MNKNELQFWRAKRCFRVAARAMALACKRMGEGHAARIQLARAGRLQKLAVAEWGKVEAI